MCLHLYYHFFLVISSPLLFPLLLLSLLPSFLPLYILYPILYTSSPPKLVLSLSSHPQDPPPLQPAEAGPPPHQSVPLVAGNPSVSNLTPGTSRTGRRSWSRPPPGWRGGGQGRSRSSLYQGKGGNYSDRYQSDKTNKSFFLT